MMFNACLEDFHVLTGGKGVPKEPSCTCIKESRGHYPASAKTVAVFFFPLLRKEKG